MIIKEETIKTRLSRNHENSSQNLITRLNRLPDNKKLVIIPEKDEAMKVYDRLKHYNLNHNCRVDITIKRGKITMIRTRGYLNA